MDVYRSIRRVFPGDDDSIATSNLSKTVLECVVDYDKQRYSEDKDSTIA